MFSCKLDDAIISLGGPGSPDVSAAPVNKFDMHISTSNCYLMLDKERANPAEYSVKSKIRIPWKPYSAHHID